MILPSLLEYDNSSFLNKLKLVKQNLPSFQAQTKARDSRIVSLHLDLVLPAFAKARSVRPSYDLFSQLQDLQTHFDSEILDLSIHLMGEKGDIQEVVSGLEKYTFNSNWEYLFLLPKFTLDTKKGNFQEPYKLFNTANVFGLGGSESQETDSNLLQENVFYGVWLDKDQWPKFDFELHSEVRDYLLMTVQAGKSGQKLDSKTKELAMQTACNLVTKKIILDGGWKIDGLQGSSNTDVVSYTSFWKAFESSLEV